MKYLQCNGSESAQTKKKKKKKHHRERVLYTPVRTRTYEKTRLRRQLRERWMTRRKKKSYAEEKFVGSRDITRVYRLFSLVTHISVQRYSTSCSPMYKFPYLSLSLGSWPGRGCEKAGKNKKGENHCSATRLGLALVTNVSVFWGCLCFFTSLLLLFYPRTKR